MASVRRLARAGCDDSLAWHARSSIVAADRPAGARPAGVPLRIDTGEDRCPRPSSSAQLVNGRLEGLNSKIRLISHRSFGFHSADALLALVYLRCTGIDIELPR